MEKSVVPFDSFGGIVNAVSQVSHKTFDNLINFKNNKKLGGLVNRYGMEYHEKLSEQPIAIGKTRFADCGDVLVVVNEQSVLTKPGIVGNKILDEFVPLANLSGPYTIGGTVIGYSGYTITSDDPNLTEDFLKQYIGGVYTATSTNNKFGITSVNGDGSFNVNTNLDELGFSISPATIQKVDSAFSDIDIESLGNPVFYSIDPNNNLVLSGAKEINSNNSLWIGRIGSKLVDESDVSSGEEQRYFGDAFRFNGIYMSPVMPEINRIGAFKSETHHIQVKVVTTGVTEETILPSATESIDNGFVDESSTPITTTAHAKVNDSSDSTYIKFPNTAFNPYGQVIFSLADPTSGQKLDQDGRTVVRFTARSYASTGLPAMINISVVEYIDGTWQEILDKNGNSITLFPYFAHYGSDLPTEFSFDQKYLRNSKNLGIKVVLYQNAALKEISLKLALLPPKIAIDNTDKDPTYAINFGFELDGFNETPLIYTGGYGTVNIDTISYADTNQASLGVDTTNRFIHAKIYTDDPYSINRRVTALKVYGGQFTAGVWVWRYCSRIALDDAQWKTEGYGSGTRYYIEVVIGDEINTGSTYETRTSRAANAELQRVIKSMAKVNNRVFAINDTDEQTIYYSQVSQNGFETSIIPSSNFIVASDTVGAIKRLFSTPSKLLIFKGQSVLASDVATMASSPRIEILSREDGLIAETSVASDGRTVYFTGYTGVKVTDGFKVYPIDTEWNNVYRMMTDTEKETCVGFIDSFSDSLYLHFKNGFTQTIWVFDTLTKSWHKETFATAQSVYLNPGDEDPVSRIYGMMTYAIKDPSDNRLLLVGNADSQFEDSDIQIYKFPRTDNLFTDKIYINGETKEIGVYLYLKTNDFEVPRGMKYGIYMDGFYCRSSVTLGVGNGVVYDGPDPDDEESTQLYFVLNDGTVLKNIPITWGREESSVGIRYPITRFSLSTSLYARAEFWIKEFGLYVSVLSQAGNIKQHLA